MLDHLVHPLDRQQSATRARVAGPTAGLAVGALALAPTLSSFRVGRGRKRGVVRVAAQLADLFLEPLHPPLEALHLVCQRQQDLDARLAPRVVDRLGLGALHVAKVRRAPPGACLCQPAFPQAGLGGPTERLRESADLRELLKRRRPESNRCKRLCRPGERGPLGGVERFAAPLGALSYAKSPKFAAKLEARPTGSVENAPSKRVVVIVAWFAILFTGRYPRGIFDFVEGVIRWHNRVVGYALILVTDRYPSFRLREPEPRAA
jgi:hypothetical protein